MKKVIKKSGEIKKLVKQLAAQIADSNLDLEKIALIGIRSRGVPLAERLAEEIFSKTKHKPDVGVLDINLYRDDMDTKVDQPMLKETIIPFDLSDKDVILVDDVLFTGRTIRSALDALIDLGRPKTVKLAVLIDRGNRELPIQPDFFAEKIDTRKEQRVRVNLKEVDGKDQVSLDNE